MLPDNRRHQRTDLGAFGDGQAKTGGDEWVDQNKARGVSVSALPPPDPPGARPHTSGRENPQMLNRPRLDASRDGDFTARQHDPRLPAGTAPDRAATSGSDGSGTGDPGSSGDVMWWQLFDEPDEPPRTRKRTLAAVSAGVGAIVIALAVWLMWPAGPPDTRGSEAAGEDGSTPSSELTAPGMSAAAPPASAEHRRLMDLVLSQGYSRGSCTTATTAPGALATVSCGHHPGHRGPVTATYALHRDAVSLRAAFDDIAANSVVVVCPGNIQSPGPWRRNATPQQVSGMLFCGLREGQPMVAWTTDADLLLSIIRADQSGPTPEELYAWWSRHA
jgi:serine/threonine-protein kinase